MRRGERSSRRTLVRAGRGAMTDDGVLRGELRDELVAGAAARPRAGRPRADPDRAHRRDHQPQLPRHASPDAPERYVIRLAGNDTHLLGISREVEHAATVAAAGVGVGPEVTAFIRPEGYLVTRFIEGSPVSDEAVRQPETLERVARRPCGASTTGRRSRACSCRSGSSRRTGRWRRPAASRSRRSTSSPPAIGRRIELACLADAARARGRATTTCSTRTSSTTGCGSGSSTGSTPGMGDPFFDLGNFSINHELTPDEDAHPARGVRRRRVRARPARAADADARRVRLPRGDVGRPPAGDQHARRRLRRVRRRALRPTARERRRRRRFERALREAAATEPRPARGDRSVAGRRPAVAEVAAGRR